MSKKKNEELRIEELLSYQVLDTPPDIHLDGIVNLAQFICDVPIVLVSLVDDSRQWFKAKVGLDVSETPRDISFCTHAIEGTGLFEVNDALEDARFHANPLVIEEPSIRFYAGMPLETSKGHNLGTLCVIDREPRKLEDRQKEALGVLANQVTRYLELGKANYDLGRQKEIIEKQQGLIQEAQNIAILTEASAKAAHEINNPLAIIQANVDIIYSLDLSVAGARVKEKLLIIYKNIDRIKNIITEMKNFSKPI